MVCAQILVLALLISSATASRCSGAKDGDPRCFNCTVTGRCEGGQVVQGKLCGPGKACTEIYGYAFCTIAKFTPCNCGGADVGCDPYDPQSQIVCPPEGSPYRGRLCEGNEVCSAGLCSPVQPTIDNPCEMNNTSTLIYPGCSAGYLCDRDVGKTHECLEGEYFDVQKLDCRTYPPNPCGSVDGVYNFPTDCSKGVACVKGRVVQEILCDEGKYFDPDNISCGTRAVPSSPCAVYAQCDFSLIKNENPTLETTSGVQNATFRTTTSTQQQVSTTPLKSTTPSVTITYTTTTTPAIVNATNTTPAIINSTNTTPAIINTTNTTPTIINTTNTTPAIINTTNTTPTIINTTNTTPAIINTTTTESAPCDKEKDGNGFFKFFFSITTHVFTSLKYVWYGTDGNLTDFGGPGGFPQGVPGGYPYGGPGGFPQGGPGGYPQGGPDGYPQGGPDGYPQGGPDGYPQGGPDGYPQGGPDGYPQGGPYVHHGPH